MIVLMDYEINKNTMVLIPCSNQDFYTKVLEPGKTFYVKKTPMQLIKESCLEGGATYEGRRTAVIHSTGVKQKVPIPIDPMKKIYAIPTHSTTQFECHWFFYQHIKALESLDETNEEHQVAVVVKDYRQIKLNVSRYILEKQLQRAAVCIVRFSGDNDLL